MVPTIPSPPYRSHRVLYAIVRRLVRVSYRYRGRSNPRPRAEDHVAARRTNLADLIAQLRTRGYLVLGSEDAAELEEVKFAATGSSVNVAIIPNDLRGRALVLKFTESAVASSELATSIDVQERLTADARLASWSTQVPRVYGSGMVGITTFGIEECLSSRDGRAVVGDIETAEALLADSLKVIGEFHRLTATRRQVDAKVLAAIVERPIEIVRANTSPGLFHLRARSLDRLAAWLRTSLVGLELEIGWTHGDFHLGNVLIDDSGRHVIGVVDWGRAEPDGLTVLDGFTLVLIERVMATGIEIGSYLLELLKDVERAGDQRIHAEILRDLEGLLDADSNIDVRCVLLLTWLKHVSNNLKNEDRTRTQALWRFRNVDLVLYGAPEILGT